VRAWARRAGGGSRFVEFRLAAGVLFCSMAYWGIQRAGEIVKISKSQQMAPWTLGTDYDRPIATRIAETAGQPVHRDPPSLLRRTDLQLAVAAYWPRRCSHGITNAQRVGRDIAGTSKRFGSGGVQRAASSATAFDPRQF